MWDRELPKTSTRKVKRKEVVAELVRIEKMTQSTNAVRQQKQAAAAKDNDSWVITLIAQVAQKPAASISESTRLDALGFDSLMVTEMGVALEAAGVQLPDPAELASLETVADMKAFVAQHSTRLQTAGYRDSAVPEQRHSKSDEISIPAPLSHIGKRGLRRLQRLTYERIFRTRVTGASYIPAMGGYIVAANHASHLDMGLVKHALGEYGDLLVAMAAKDYFFEDAIRRAYFENFTNLVPMERYGSLRESLRLAVDIIRAGNILLIFPEGTRSESGVMVDFKASLGYLAKSADCGILPMYLAGTHDAFPKGAWIPKQRTIAAHIGPHVTRETLKTLTTDLSRSESYRVIANHLETIVRGLAPASCAWTLGESGRQPWAEWKDKRASQSYVSERNNGPGKSDEKSSQASTVPATGSRRGVLS